MEIERKVGCRPFRLLVFFSLLVQVNANLTPAAGTYKVEVGVILDMGSWTGKSIHSCITMAVSDFFASNNHYKTRIVLHTRDSMGDPTRAISEALDLLENIRVKVLLIGPETTDMEGKFLAVIGSKFYVPIFSFSSIVSSRGHYPFLVQIKQDETFQFKGITAVLKSYQWKTINVIYEESDDGREILSHLFDPLKEANIHIAHRIVISPFSTDDQILNDLQELSMQSTNAINVVHMPPSLTSRLFPIAKGLGMMKEGYAWIITDRTMNLLHTLDTEVIELMQGALGFKAYIPASSRLQDFTLRWRKEFYEEYRPTELIRELDVLCIWAYDALWALGESAERVGVDFLDSAANQSVGLSSLDTVNWVSGKRLLIEMPRMRFTGLSGEFQILNGKLSSESYLILNVLGKGDRRVGFWTPKDGIVKEIEEPLVKDRHPSPRRGLEAVVWPGGSTAVPKRRWFGKTLRVGVVNNLGFRELVNVHRDPQTIKIAVTGFCIDVFEAAIRSLDYEVEYEFIPFIDQSGENLGSYTDFIDQVYFQKYDAVVGDTTITANRSLYVDFTMPYTDLGVGMIRRRDQNNDMWVFLKPLQTNLWLASAAFFVLLGSVVWTIEHRNNADFQGSRAHQIGTILWFGFSTLVYAHREKLTSNLSRFVVIVWLFVVLILTSSYTATLSSMLTFQQIQVASGREYIGVQIDSIVDGVISSNLNFEDDRLQQYGSPEEYADALSEGSKNGGVDAIIDEIPYIKIFLAKYGSDYAMVTSTAQSTNGFGFAFQKGSPLVSHVSLAITKMRETGGLAKIENDWFRGQTNSFMPENDTNSSMPNSLRLGNFGGLFFLSMVSFVLALVLHLIFMCQQSNNIIITLLSGGKLAFISRLLTERNQNVVHPDVENGEQGLAGLSLSQLRSSQ